mmetsp:Transcript_31932/g.66639  ORF Transcript_31932/g.66639 Transcript_31932/m.66639 type:complete len:483 (-) Transcript_31932:155-1603(-)
MGFQDMWMRRSSDVASQVSSDGSSFIFAHPEDEDEEDAVDIEYLLNRNPLGGQNSSNNILKSRTSKQLNTRNTPTTSRRLDYGSPTSMASSGSKENVAPNRRPSPATSSQYAFPQTKLVGSRQQRNQQEQSTTTNTVHDPSMWQFFEGSWQMDYLGVSSDEGEIGDAPITVVVEATAICDLDLRLQSSSPYSCQDMMNSGALSVPGTNFVGVVQKEDEPTDGVEKRSGTRVAALVPNGSNARYITVPARLLHPVPKQLDSADICGVLSSFLPAFSALHHGQSRPYRYSRKCLEGRHILIAGCTSLEAQAAIRLAQIAGAESVFVTAPHAYAKVLGKLGAHVLGENSEDWLPFVERKMDVVLDYQFPNQFHAVRAALAPKGRLTCCSACASVENQQCCFPMEHVVEYCYLAYMKRATLFDFADELENYEEVRQDFDFLLRLLSMRLIRPEIDRYIGLNEVARAQEDIRQRPLNGSIICEPWKD